MLIKKHQNKFAKTLKHGSYFASFLIDIIYTAYKAIVVAAAVFEKETKHDQPNFSAFSFYINVLKLMLSFERGDVKCNLGISKLWVPN